MYLRNYVFYFFRVVVELFRKKMAIFWDLMIAVSQVRKISLQQDWKIADECLLEIAVVCYLGIAVE